MSGTQPEICKETVREDHCDENGIGHARKTQELSPDTSGNKGIERNKAGRMIIFYYRGLQATCVGNQFLDVKQEG